MKKQIELLEYAKQRMIDAKIEFLKWNKEFNEINNDLGYNLTNYEDKEIED